MGRDTLRQLEDEIIKLDQAKRYGKLFVSINTIIWLVNKMAVQQKEINALKEILKIVLDKHTKA